MPPPSPGFLCIGVKIGPPDRLEPMTYTTSYLNHFFILNYDRLFSFYFVFLGYLLSMKSKYSKQGAITVSDTDTPLILADTYHKYQNLLF